MANDLNQCQFIGRLGADPETRYMPSGDPITSFRIAVGSQWKDKNGEKQESAEWVSIAAFGKLAEICGEYLKKGSQVFVSGRLKTDEFEKDGIKRYSTKIVAERMQMLGGRPDRTASHSAEGGGAGVAKRDDARSFDDMTDDIPF